MTKYLKPTPTRPNKSGWKLFFIIQGIPIKKDDVKGRKDLSISTWGLFLPFFHINKSTKCEKKKKKPNCLPFR